jgi:mono/diheme cytochrome c family protein
MRKLTSSLCCLVLLGALAHAEPKNEPTTLSTEQAKLLAQDKSGRLLLNRLTTVSPEAAKELARFDGWLSLNGLASLSKETAEALAQHKGPIHLNGLTKLSDESAVALSRHFGELSLNGLSSLSEEAANALAKHTGGRLYLKSVTSLSTEGIKAFAQRKGGGPSHQSRLDGLTSLTPEGAAALAGSHPHNWDGRLPAMKTIPEDVALALAKRQGMLSLEGLETISDEAAKALQGKLDGKLPKLTSLTLTSAKAIVGPVPGQFHRSLILDGLTELPDDIALAIGGKDSRGDLHLNGLTTLTPIAAKAICQREGDVFLNGLTNISAETLKALAEHKAPGVARPVVYLNGLTTLSDENAAILAAWPKWCGELPALTTLSEKAATSLAASRNWDGKLPAVKQLPAEVATALAQRQGNLTLDGLAELSDEAAAALAEHRGGTLSLNGLKNLSDKTAGALARHDGRLTLTGLTTLSDAAAGSLAKHPGDWLILDGLTTLTDPAAKVLAQHKGVVSLNGLTTLAPETLKALKSNTQMGLPEKFRTAVVHQPAKADAKIVSAFLETHCASCHDAQSKSGDFTLAPLDTDDVPGRVAYASILERLRAGDMPPPSKKERPDPAEVAGVAKWIEAKLDTPMSAKPTYFAVKEKPIDGNRLPNAILFGGPRGPSVPPPPRLWRLSPSAYSKWVGEFNSNGLQQPFGVIQDAGFRDFASLYTPDEGATGLLLSNAEQLVNAQVRGHGVVNIIDTPAAAKEKLWPNEARIKTATDAERELLKKGVRVRQGDGTFAPLMHPQVRATKEELEKAIRQQYQTAIARQPSEKELASVLALYDDIAKDGDLSLAGKTILMAPMLTPEAILRFEVGMGAEVRPGVRMLSPRETAFALSLALSSKRDPGLLTAAAQGKLTTREEVAESVKRILDDPKIDKSQIMWFFREYLDYYRAPEVFKDPLPDYMTRRGVHYNARSTVDDTDFAILNILAHDKEVLKELLTTTSTYRSHELFTPGKDGTIFRHLPPISLENQGPKHSDRIGVLMQPSWQVAWSTNFHNDIVRRGRWVREHLLGGRVPDLPINAAAMIPDDPHHTLRVRQMVTREAQCWKCHYRMDELGLPFEDVTHYGFPRRTEEVLDLDAVAQSKDKNAKIYRGAPLDTTGFIAYSGDPKLDGPVKDAPEMLRRLAESDRVRQVFIRHAFRFFLGRNETPGDAVSLQDADRAYVESGGSFKALLVSLLSSESFLYRTVPAKEKK